ncbi:MAG: ribonuclease regulator RraA [Ramlibacter sp.]|nr:ribonuclease regulator RraA [Ramlibacter sp.]
MTTESLALDASIVRTLSAVSTGTITTVLLKKGLRNIWMRGTLPLAPGQPRLVGRAFTLRFVPAREDLATPASWGSPISTRAVLSWVRRTCLSAVPEDTSLIDLASRQAVPVRGSYCLGHRLRGDCAALFGLGPAPRNSLRALGPLRSNNRGESELMRASAPGPRPNITADTEIAPAGYRLSRVQMVACHR